jgi:hypothetical protein
MAQEIIDFGSYPNDANADPVRAAFQKAQNNFTELYTAVATTGVTSITAGAGLTQDLRSGNVTIKANIPNITIQTGNSLLIGVGTATSNTATITRGTTPFVITLANTIRAENMIATRLTGTLTTNAHPNITSVGTLTSLNVSGNANATTFNGNIVATSITAASYTAPAGNTHILYNQEGVMQGSGELTWNETTLNVIGNITSQNANLGNLVKANYFQGRLTADSNAQPNITTVGTLTNVSTSGNITAVGNVTADTFKGNIEATTISGTFTSPGANTQLLFNNIGVIDGTNKITFNGSTLTITANLSANNANLGNLATANYLKGTLILESNSQPNITSVGTLTSLSVRSTATVGNLTTTGNVNVDRIIETGNLRVSSSTVLNTVLAGNITATSYTGNGYNLSSLYGPNVIGTVANAGNSVNSRNSNTANVSIAVSGNDQPNITSVGTLSNLEIDNKLTASIGEFTDTLTAAHYVGNGNGITYMTGANVRGNVASAVTSFQSNVSSLTYAPYGFNTGNYNLAFVDNSTGGTGNLKIKTNQYLIFDSTTGQLAVPSVKALYNVISQNVVTINATISGVTNLSDVNSNGVITTTSSIAAVDAAISRNLSSGNLTVTDNIQTDALTSSGNVKIRGTLTTKDIVASGNVEFPNANILAFNAVFKGELSASGNANLGTITSTGSLSVASTASVKNLTVNGKVTTSLIPEFDTLNNLGTSLIRWGTVYSLGVNIGSVTLRNSQDVLQVANNITAVGNIISANVKANNTLTGNILSANSGYILGNLTVGGTLALNGLFNAANISTDGNLNVLGNSITQTLKVYGNTSLANVVASSISSTRLGTKYEANVGSLYSTGNIVTDTNITANNINVTDGIVQCGTLTTGAFNTKGSITGNWQLSQGSRLVATYADLAEYYAADSEIESGTVVEFGGVHEIRICDSMMSKTIAGVVTTNPAYVMNSMIKCEYPVAVALQGRVPVKVTGSIRKGDMLVSAGQGRATAISVPMIGTVIGKSLQNFDGDEGIIEVAIGRL